MRARAVAGMARARDELTWARAAEAHENLYAEVLAMQPRRPAAH